MALFLLRGSFGAFLFLGNSVVYARPQASAAPTPSCTIGFDGDTVARICNCEGYPMPLPILGDPASPGVCAYTTLPPIPPPPSSTDDPNVFTAPLTTITNADGSSFTALLQTTTDAAGSLSTWTVTVNAVASGEPEITETTQSSVSPPAGTTLPAFITTVISGTAETFSQTLFADLTTVTAPTTVTTPITETKSDGTTVIPVPIVIGPGGIGFIGPIGPLPPEVPFPNGPPPATDNPLRPTGTDNNPPSPTGTDMPTATCSTEEVPQCTASCIDDGTSTTCTTTVCATTTACGATGFTTSVITTTTSLPVATAEVEIETERPADDNAVDVFVVAYLTSLYNDLGVSDSTKTVSSPPASTNTNPPPPTSCGQSSDCPQSACSPDQTPICSPDGKCLCGSSSLSLGPLEPSTATNAPPPPSPTHSSQPVESCVDQSLALGVVVCDDYPCEGGAKAACVNGFCACPCDGAGSNGCIGKRGATGTTLTKVYISAGATAT